MLNILKNKFSIFDKSQENSKTKTNNEFYGNEDISENINDNFNDNFNESDANSNVKNYHYLEEDYNPLSNHFGDFNDLTKSYKIHLCIYKINLECKIPFIQFLIDNSDIPSFPSIDGFMCQIVDDVEPNTTFMNKCLPEVVNRLDIHNIFGVDLLGKMYKGFIEQDDNIFAVFECLTEFNSVTTKKNRWCILAEILENSKVDNKFMDPILKSFFMKNPFMTEIMDIDGNVYPNPSLLYLCESSNDENKIIVGTTKRFIDTTMKHEWLGEYYFFTIDTTFLDIINNDYVQKYAVFTDNTRYILTDISKISDVQKEVFLKNSSNNVVLSVYFHQDGKQYWYVKNNNNFTRI